MAAEKPSERLSPKHPDWLWLQSPMEQLMAERSQPFDAKVSTTLVSTPRSSLDDILLNCFSFVLIPLTNDDNEQCQSAKMNRLKSIDCLSLEHS